MTDLEKLQLVMKWAEKHPEFSTKLIDELWDDLERKRSAGIPAKFTYHQKKYVDDVIFIHKILESEK